MQKKAMTAMMMMRMDQFVARQEPAYRIANNCVAGGQLVIVVANYRAHLKSCAIVRKLVVTVPNCESTSGENDKAKVTKTNKRTNNRSRGYK